MIELVHGRAEDHLARIAPEVIVTDAPKSMLVWLIEYAERTGCLVIEAYCRGWIVGPGGAKDWRHYSRLVRPFARVCDPFMGTGAIGVAAAVNDVEFVGIECDRARYETAVERLRGFEDAKAR